MANITLDDLAGMIGKGFNEMNEKLDKVNVRLEALETGQEELKEEMHREFALIQSRIDEMSKRVVYRDEFEALKREVASLKAKLATA